MYIIYKEMDALKKMIDIIEREAVFPKYEELADDHDLLHSSGWSENMSRTNKRIFIGSSLERLLEYAKEP